MESKAAFQEIRMHSGRKFLSFLSQHNLISATIHEVMVAT